MKLSSKNLQIKVPIIPDVWMINGMETLYTLVNEIGECRTDIEPLSIKIEIYDLEKFLKFFSEKIKEKQDEIIFIKKIDDKGQVRYVKKDFVLIQYGKAVGGRNVLKEKIYSETEKRLKDIFSSIKEGNKTCIICGRRFKKSVDKLKQAVHPFATKIKSLSGVRTLKENYDNICPLCYLIGTLEWLDDAIIYRCFLGSGDRTYSLIFLPFELNLEKLHKCKKMYREILKTNMNSPISNLLKIVKSQKGEEKRVGYEGEHTTILNFFEKFIKEILGEYKEIEDKEFEELYGKIEREFCKSWVTLKIPSGKVKNVEFNRLNLKDEFIYLLTRLGKKEVSIYDKIIDKIKVYDRNKNYNSEKTNETRELLAKAIIFDNFRLFSKLFLPRKNIIKYNANLKYLDELIKLWGLKKMKLEENLSDIKNAARQLAKLLKNHLGVVYEMDKSRTKEDFIKVYQQACRRLLGLKEEERKGIFPPALEKFTDLVVTSSENEWKTLRDVLLIYTSIYISKGEQKDDVSGGDTK